MGRKFVVIREEWFVINSIVEECQDQRDYYTGLLSTKWAPVSRIADLYEHSNRLREDYKFQFAPVGYKVTPITIGKQTFYV